MSHTARSIPLLVLCLALLPLAAHGSGEVGDARGDGDDDDVRL